MTIVAAARMVGIDGFGDRIVCAIVERGQGGLQVASIDEQLPVELQISSDSSVTLSVPDDQCQTKNLRLRGANREEVELRAKFELSQSLLEPYEAFQFDVLATSMDDRYIGVVYRRELLNERAAALGIAAGDSPRVMYRPRAASLRAAYKAFCMPAGGDLVCLADFESTIVSVCLMYRNEIAALAFLPVALSGGPDGADVRRVAVNLKTVVNFKLLSLADDGITIPLSALMISGSQLDDNLKKALEDFFPAGVRYPEFKTSSFAHPELAGNGSALRSMVALGLAVN